MVPKEAVIQQILEAFTANTYPGDAFLQGSFEGCEPFEETGAFKGRTDWTTLDAAMLDARYTALGFFSEAAFRFFLPAYLFADLRGELRTAEPLFHLTGGFIVFSAQLPAGPHAHTRKTGGSTLLNPRRYGAITFEDYARYRLSVFTREEAKAIVAYLRCKQESDEYGIDTPAILAAINTFWLDRSEHAPTRASLEAHLVEETEFLAHLRTNPSKQS